MIKPFSNSKVTEIIIKKRQKYFSKFLDKQGKWQNPYLLTLFFPMFPFDPPENIRKPKVFWCFQGYQKGTLRRKGLMWDPKDWAFPDDDSERHIFFKASKRSGFKFYLEIENVFKSKWWFSLCLLFGWFVFLSSFLFSFFWAELKVISDLSLAYHQCN